MTKTIPVKFRTYCNNPQAYIQITPANIKKMTLDLWLFLCKMDCNIDVSIYYKQKDRWDRISYNKPSNNQKEKTTEETYSKNNTDVKYYFTKNVEPTIEWTGNILCMTFEGPLYHALNYDIDSKMSEYLDNFFSNYGLYTEFGYAWSLAVYEM